MNTYRGNISIAPLILNLGTRRRWMVNFRFRPLYCRGRTPTPIEQGAGWVSESVWTFL